MERLKAMKEMLMACAEGQMTHLEEVDAKELGEVVDMIKDLEETIYYCTIVEAMKQPKEQYSSGGEQSYFRQPVYGGGWDDVERRSYYSDGGNRSTATSGSNGGNNGSSSMNYTEREYPYEFKDHREGRSPHSRRMYMEARETHQDKTAQMRELEKYMQELTQDLVEMIEGASAEEKQYLNKKIAALSNKIGQLND